MEASGGVMLPHLRKRLSKLLQVYLYLGTSAGIMVCKLDYQTLTSEFDSQWVPSLHGLVPHLSKKKLCRFLLVFLHLHQTLALSLECSLMSRETWVQSQIESYQILLKWYLILPCLTLSIIRYGLRVK